MNKINLHHTRTTKGNWVQHIEVNDIELSNRTLRDGDDAPLYNRFIEFLNDKAQEELEKDPTFLWTSLSDFRVWANSYLDEFLAEDEKILAEELRLSSLKANR